MTVILETENEVDVVKMKEQDKEEETIEYIKMSLSEGAQGLIDLSKREECAIDCDLYQLLYGLQLGSAL